MLLSGLGGVFTAALSDCMKRFCASSSEYLSLSIMSKKQLHTTQQITAFIEELKAQTDRGAVLIAAAVLDELLEMTISARLIEVGGDRHAALFGRGKPIDSFSAKIELGFRLGLYQNPARVQFEMIRDIRNKFAHRIEPLTFSHPDIAQAIISRRLKHSPEGPPTRDEYFGMFALLANMLYGIMAADIRIRPLSETHADHLTKMARIVATLAATDQQTIRPAQDEQPGPPKPRPES
jgi:hypothetical protein